LSNCWKIEFQDGGFQGYLPNGYAVFGSELKKDADPLVAANRFPGGLAKSQVINGAGAFAFYSPCDADFSLQKIPSEPLANEYSDAKLALFNKVNADAKPISITCPGTDQARYNGEVWTGGDQDCEQFECKNGVVYESWICPSLLCTDKITNKSYKKNQKWIDSVNPCKEHTCVLAFDDVTTKDIVCESNLVCADGYQPIKLTTECCHKCPSDTCAPGKKYYEGCKQTCDDGATFVCPSKKVGCWCPAGMVEDDKGNCISLATCPCVSGGITYQPGQTAIRSSCSTCVCLNSEMECFERC